jgi:hypothetical protein
MEHSKKGVLECSHPSNNHTRLFLETGDFWHQEQADILRKYIKDLKVWIHKEEGWWNE